MVSPPPTAASELPPASENFTITLRGREYPVADRISNPLPVEEDRNAQVAERLWSELPFSALDLPCQDRTLIVKAYADSIARMHQCRREMERLFTLMGQINLQFRVQGPLHEDLREDALRLKQEEMLNQGRFAPFLDDGTLTAELTAETPEWIASRLDKSLRSLTHSFVRDVFAALDRFVGAEMVGLIDWFGENEETCKFHFFSRTIIQSEAGQSQHRGRERRKRRDAGTVEVSQKLTHIAHGAHLHQLARHEHHLMNAKSYPLGGQMLPVPLAAQRLIAAIPDWLGPLVRIVEGDRIRERIIERDVRTEEWRKTHQETVRRLERIHYQIDPAVTLDRYVLTGWGERAIQDEKQRLERLRQEQEMAKRREDRDRLSHVAGGNFRLAAAGVGLAQVLAVVLMLLSRIAPPLVIAATFLTLGSLVPLGFALKFFATWQLRQADWKYLATGTAAALTATVGLELIILGAIQPWLLLMGLGLLSIALGYVFARKAILCYRLLPELPC